MVRVPTVICIVYIGCLPGSHEQKDVPSILEAVNWLEAVRGVSSEQYSSLQYAVSGSIRRSGRLTRLKI